MTQLLDIFHQSQTFFLSFIFIISLVIGSGLNVIIFRLPKILDKIWHEQCNEFLHKTSPKTHNQKFSKSPLYKLFVRNSHCLECNHDIKFYDNIPLISYIILMGKCRHCKCKISLQYPCVEALSAILATCVALRFGVSVQTLAGLILTYILIVQSAIDCKHTLIPDEITLPTLWLGMLISITAIFTNSSAAILGAVFGYLLLWGIYWLFWLFTKKEGMGYGDFKLLAMLGAWLGWTQLPFIILASSVLGTIIGVGIISSAKKKRNIKIPFGPFLAIAGWISLLYGTYINNWYWHFVGIQ